MNHVSWNSPSGLMLLGGHYSRRTTALLSTTSSSSSAQFDLLYDTNSACGIEVPNSDQLVITGGHASGSDALSRVQVYTVGGSKRRLAELTQPRKEHACGYFFNNG